MLPTDKATTKQTWAIFLKTGYDVRGCNLTHQDVQDIFNGTKQAGGFTGAILKRKVVNSSDSTGKEDFESIYNKAVEAGMEAGAKVTPVPMIVREHANPLDSNSPIIKQYQPVNDGVCGFASIKIKGNTAFGKWAKNKQLARPCYPTGLSFYVHEFNQSLTRKEAYAQAFAKVLNANSITAYAESRMD